MIDHCQRYGRLETLIAHCQKLRPHLSWTAKPIIKTKTEPANDKKSSSLISFSKIIVGVLAVIGFGSIVFYISQIVRQPSSPSLPDVVTTATTTALPDAASSATVSLAEGNCFDQFFAGIASSRITTLEDGVDDFVVIETDQSQEDELGILFTTFNQPIGAMRIFPFPDSRIFKVMTVVDANCQEVEGYADFGSGLRAWLIMG